MDAAVKDRYRCSHDAFVLFGAPPWRGMIQSTQDKASLWLGIDS